MLQYDTPDLTTLKKLFALHERSQWNCDPPSYAVVKLSKLEEEEEENKIQICRCAIYTGVQHAFSTCNLTLINERH